MGRARRPATTRIRIFRCHAFDECTPRALPDAHVGHGRAFGRHILDDVARKELGVSIGRDPRAAASGFSRTQFAAPHHAS